MIPQNIKIIAALIIVFSLTYVLNIIYSWWLSKHLFLKPKIPTPIADHITWVETKSQNMIPLIYEYAPMNKYTLLISHGICEDVGMHLPLIKHIIKQLNVNLAYYDYSGYGLSYNKNTGKPPQPTEKQCYEDIDAVYNYLVNIQNIPFEKIILFGWSLGTAPTLYIGAKYKVGAVILQSPFESIFRAYTRKNLPDSKFDIFRNMFYIKMLRAPLLIIHGNKDKLIPIQQAQNLFDAAASKIKIFTTIVDVGHADIEAKKLADVILIIDNFINNLENTHLI